MSTLREDKRFKNLNKYSWLIMLMFICTAFAMLYRTAPTSVESFFQTLPLIIIAIYYCEKWGPLIGQPEKNLKRSELFARDLFILSFSFLSACLFSLIFSYNNSDVKGWWSLIIYLITLYGLLFSIFFSALALLIENHKIYTFVFSFLIFILISFGKMVPFYISIPLLGNVDTFFVIISSLLIFHCLFIINYKIFKQLTKRK